MDNNEQKQPVKLPKWVMIGLITSLAFNGATYLQLKSANREITNLKNNVYNIQSSVNSSVSNSINSINHLLEKEASLISEFKYELGEYKDKKIDVILSAKPKTYTKGEKILFLCKAGNDSPQLIEAETSDNIAFSAKTNMSIFDNMEIDLVIDDGTIRKTQKMDSINRPSDNFTARLNPIPMGGSMSYNKQKQAMVTTYEFELQDYGKDKLNYKLMDVKLVITVNDRVIEEMPMERMDVDPHVDRYHIQLKSHVIPCSEGDTVKVYITAKDDKGFNYRCNLEGWKIEQQRINHLTQDYGMVEVY